MLVPSSTSEAILSKLHGCSTMVTGPCTTQDSSRQCLPLPLSFQHFSPPSEFLSPPFPARTFSISYFPSAYLFISHLFFTHAEFPLITLPAEALHCLPYWQQHSPWPRCNASSLHVGGTAHADHPPVPPLSR